MPQALAGVLVKWGLSKLAATIIAHAITFASMFGLSQLFKPGRPKPEDGQIETRAAVGSRKKNWGIVHTSGQVSFEASKKREMHGTRWSHHLQGDEQNCGQE